MERNPTTEKAAPKKAPPTKETPKVKKYTTPGPHLEEVEDTAENRAAMNEETPSPVPRREHQY